MTGAQIMWTANVIAEKFAVADRTCGRTVDDSQKASAYYGAAIGLLVEWNRYFETWPPSSGRAKRDWNEWIRACRIPEHVRESRIWFHLAGSPHEFRPIP